MGGEDLALNCEDGKKFFGPYFSMTYS